jgi:predicted dehydrogenase
MSFLRFGLVGSGKVAALHMDAIAKAASVARDYQDGSCPGTAASSDSTSDFASTPECRVVSVCSRDPARRHSFAARYGIEARGSISAMAELDAVDVVVIAAPHPQHRILALEALASGCHVLVEKPMALTTADCREMIEAAQQADRLLGVISQRRWYPSVQRIRRAIDAGALGKPSIGQVLMLGWRDEAYYRSDPWRGRWDLEGGGVLVNQAPHQLDLLAWFMGPVAEVSAYWGNINHPYIEVEDSAVAALRFGSGGMGSILVSNSQKPGIYAKVHIHGSSGASAGVQTDGGAMFIAGMSGVLEPPYNDIWTIPGEESQRESWRREDEALFATVDPTRHFFSLQFADFARAIQKGTRPAVTGEDGLETVRIMEGIYRSGTEGKPVCP